MEVEAVEGFVPEDEEEADGSMSDDDFALLFKQEPLPQNWRDNWSFRSPFQPGKAV